MPDFQVVVVAVFKSIDGAFPPPAEMAQQIVDAFLAHEPKLWSFVYPVEVVEAKPVDPRWWLGKAMGFAAYARLDMEQQLIAFDSEQSTTPKLMKVSWPMKVSKLSASGLRFRVLDKPEIWILAHQTQEEPV